MKSEVKKKDQVLMDILKVNTVIRLICETNMGALKLNIRKGEQNYFFTLDSVELPKDLNKVIYELLYAPEIPQVDIVGRNRAIEVVKTATAMIDNVEKLYAKPDTGVVVDLKKVRESFVENEGKALGDELIRIAKKKGGRPKGSVNKKN